VFCTVHRYNLCAKMFFGLDLNQEEEALTNSSECRPWGKCIQLECSLKPMLIPYGWCILAKQSDPDWFPYDFT